MPQKITISDDLIKQIVTPDLERAKSWQDELREQREQFLLLYSMSKDADGIKHLNKPGFSQVVTPLVYESVEGMKVGLDQLFTSPDFFGIKVGEDAEAGERLRKLVRWNIFENQYGARVIRWWLDGCLKYHYGVLKVFWDEQYREETQEFDSLAQPDAEQLLAAGWQLAKYKEIVGQQPISDPMTGLPMFDEAGNPQTEPVLMGLSDVKATKQVPTFIGPRILAVDPETFFYSPDSDELDQCRIVAHRVSKRLEDIRKGEDAGFYRKGSYVKVQEKLSSNDSDLNIEDKDYRYDAADLSTPASDDTGSEISYVQPSRKVELWEIYTSIDVDNDGILEPVIIHMAHDVVLSIQENPYKRPPFRIARAIEAPWKLEGVPYPESLKQLQVELTQQTRMFNDACGDSVYGNLITSDQTLADNWVNRGIGHVLMATSVGTVTDKKYDVIRSAAPDPSILKAMEMSEGRAERVSGVTRYNQGIDANSLNKTATGIQTIASLAQQRQKYMANVIAECWKDVLEDVVGCFRLFGGPYLQYFAAKGNEINPQDFQSDFTVSIELGIGPQEKAQQAAILQQFIQFAAQIGVPAGLMSITHVAKMIDRVGQLMSIPLEQYHYSEAELRQMQQQKAMAQQAQQQQAQQFAAREQQIKAVEAVNGAKATGTGQTAGGGIGGNPGTNGAVPAYASQAA